MSLSELEQLKQENAVLRKELRESTSSINDLNIFYRLDEWTWEVDTKGVYTYASDNVTRVLGYTPEEMLGKTPFDFMSDSEATRVGTIFMDIATKKEPFSKLFNTSIHKDGNEIHTETCAEPLYDNFGYFVGYRGIGFDRTKEYINTQSLITENSSLMQELRDKNELLINVTNSISDCIFYKDTSYRYVGCNQAFSNFVGIPIDYIIGKTDYELFSPEHADLFRSMDKLIFEHLKEHTNNEWVKHADGSTLYFLTKKAPLVDTKSNIIGLVGISKDLSNEHELEKQLKESNTYLVDAQSIAKIGHWDWNIKDGELFWSDEIYKVFGYRPQEFDATYEAFLNTIHPDDRHIVSNSVDEALKSNSEYDVYHRIVLPTGEEKFVHEVGHAIYDEEGSPLRMIGTVQDITDLHQVQIELSQQKEAFESIFEYSTDGATLIENGRFIACNEAIVKMLKASNKDEILNMHPSQFSPEFQPDGKRSFDKAEEMIQTCLVNGHNHFEWLHLRKNGEQFWSEILLTRIKLSDKTIIHTSWRDISQRKELNSHLEASNKKYQELAEELDIKVKEQSAQMIKQSRMAQMGELLSMIAHQWRQPLSSISAISSAVKIKTSLTSDSDMSVKNAQFLNIQMDDIDELTQSLSNTIDDFRTLYKPDKIMKYFQLHEPVDKALKLLEPSFTKDGIKVKKLYGEDPFLLMHGNEIMQVILNLLKNAEDNFNETKVDNPYVVIKTSLDGLTAKISIEDNGGGIKDNILHKIFDPYFSTKDEKNGTGLGLYMSKIIIEQHHKGKLDVYNTKDGVCFNIELQIQ